MHDNLIHETQHSDEFTLNTDRLI